MLPQFISSLTSLIWLWTYLLNLLLAVCPEHLLGKLRTQQKEGWKGTVFAKGFTILSPHNCFPQHYLLFAVAEKVLNWY
jgi:hypothetical protein